MEGRALSSTALSQVHSACIERVVSWFRPEHIGKRSEPGSPEV